MNPAVFLVSVVVISLLVGVLVGRALWGPGQQDIHPSPSKAKVRPSPLRNLAPQERMLSQEASEKRSIKELADELEEMTARLISRRQAK